MRFKAVMALLVGAVGYLLTVLICLLFGQPLPVVFLNGLKIMLAVIVLTWTGLYLLQSYLVQDEGRDEIDSKSQPEGERDDGEEFSPLKPPVLEVDNNEED